MAMFPVPHTSEWHCHTTCSDGALSPEALAGRAVASGIKTLAITDHDNFRAYRELSQIRLPAPRLVTGMEMSVVWRGMTLHVLSYGFPADDPGHLAFEKLQDVNRQARAEQIADKLERKLGVSDILAHARKQAAGDTPGRPHFALALVEQGVADTVSRAFERWLGQGKMGDVKSHWPTLDEAMKMTGSGIRVLAHPIKYKMTATRLRECLSEFRALGGEGVELSAPGISSGWYGQLLTMAKRYELLVSGGSDFHRPGSWSVLGRYPKLPSRMPDLASRLLEVE
ncbi:MAG: PHP domain-containing protein [Gammaproteobacteria bacterium]|nr:MAG: PHP domain-containing protein [Gammaproteobacteria bacterium]